jgi:hypothetical protein
MPAVALLFLSVPALRIASLAAGELTVQRAGDQVSATASDTGAETEPHLSWPYPQELGERLGELAQDQQCLTWCHAVQAALGELNGSETLGSPQAATSLSHLRELLAQGFALAETVRDPAAQSRLTRAAYALKRRLAVWSQIAAVTAGAEHPASLSVLDTEYLSRVFDQVDAKLAEHKNGPKWREYLLLEEARRLYCTESRPDATECRRLARQILLRLDYSILAPEHSKFLTHQTLADYAAALKRLAAEPVDYSRLLAELERYESRPTSAQARHISAVQQILRWSHDKQLATLGQQLDANYRNANVRVTIDGDFINRLLPPQEPVTERVNDVILGARTWGYSESQTQLRVKLLPCNSAWRIALEAEGQVASETYSAKGPATFRSLGDAVFLAEKEIEVHPHGYQDYSADASARTSAELAGLQTNLDPVPLVSDLVQAIAEQRYRRQAPLARSEMQNLVASRARDRLDTEVREQLTRARERFNEHLFDPLEQLALNPVVLQMYTTEQQLVARYRLAGHQQLAAHTPRPTAAAGSAVSVQIHESALNNLVEQLHWEGREANLRDLYAEIGQLFKIPDLKLPADFPEDVTVRFAPNTPMRFSFDEGRLGFELSLAELEQGRKRWRNFAVRVHYRPVPERADVDLVRDQYVELAGPRLKFGDQIALRGVFSRVFAKDQPFDLVSRLLRDDPRLDGYRVSQISIGDGWLGLAIGAESPSPAARLTRRPNAG